MARKLPSVTVASREVANKETGLDLYVYEERRAVVSKRTIRDTFYNIVVVSNLPNFGAGEGKTVQYTIDKSHEDFEKLHRNLTKKFSGTLFPDVPSKPISILDNVEKARDRKKKLDAFVKFCAKTTKIVNSEHLQKFLGVENKKENIDATEQTDESAKSNEPTTPKIATDLFNDAIDTGTELFGEVDEDDNEDIVDVADVPAKSQGLANPERIPKSTEVKLFDGSLESPDADNLITMSRQGSSQNAAEEDELFDLDDSDDDDMADLMNRLDKARIAREERGKQLKERVNVGPKAKESKAEERPGLEDLNADDITKYISDNAVRLDDLDLGL